VESPKTRPVGISILALFLGWLAVAGFGNSFIWYLAASGWPKDAPERLVSAVTAIASPVVSMVCLLYGATAAAATVGLWRMHRWAPPALLA
jgi:hypothetical protein